jgi:hypothetical protein
MMRAALTMDVESCACQEVPSFNRELVVSGSMAEYDSALDRRAGLSPISDARLTYNGLWYIAPHQRSTQIDIFPLLFSRFHVRIALLPLQCRPYSHCCAGVAAAVSMSSRAGTRGGAL